MNKTYRIPRSVAEYIEPATTMKFVAAAVFNTEVSEGDDLSYNVYAAAFAYKVMLDMHIESRQAVNILRFFRNEFTAWDGEQTFILSLNDGNYAVIITEPECRRIYDYKRDVDRTHPTEAIPLPAPVVQASVNLSKVVELELQI